MPNQAYEKKAMEIEAWACNVAHPDVPTATCDRIEGHPGLHASFYGVSAVLWAKSS